MAFGHVVHRQVFTVLHCQHACFSFSHTNTIIFTTYSNTVNTFHNLLSISFFRLVIYLRIVSNSFSLMFQRAFVSTTFKTASSYRRQANKASSIPSGLFVLATSVSSYVQFLLHHLNLCVQAPCCSCATYLYLLIHYQYRHFLFSLQYCQLCCYCIYNCLDALCNLEY